MTIKQLVESAGPQIIANTPYIMSTVWASAAASTYSFTIGDQTRFVIVSWSAVDEHKQATANQKINFVKALFDNALKSLGELKKSPEEILKQAVIEARLRQFCYNLL